MKQSEFVERFGSIFEHSPWVAEDAFLLLEEAGFLKVSQLKAIDVHAAMVSAFRRSEDERRMAVVLAHPDLAGKLAQAKKLTEASTKEQASAGLDVLSDEEREIFTTSNKSYVEKFGFPFIIAVKDNTKQSIMTAFINRLKNDRAAEFNEACAQIERIAYHRLKDLLG